jgi:hypothetical protein
VSVSEMRRPSRSDPAARIERLLTSLGIVPTARLVDGKWIPRISGLLTYEDENSHPFDDDALDEIVFGLFRVTNEWPERDLVRVMVKGLCIRNGVAEEVLDV